MFLLHRRFSHRCGTECHDLPMTNVMSSRRGWYDAVISGVIGPRGCSGGDRVKRGLRPQGAQRRRGGTPPRIETTKLRRRSREAGAPSSKRPQALKRGHCQQRKLPVTRSGGSVLKALSAAEGALPRERKPARTAVPNHASHTSDTKIPVSAPLQGRYGDYSQSLGYLAFSEWA